MGVGKFPMASNAALSVHAQVGALTLAGLRELAAEAGEQGGSAAGAASDEGAAAQQLPEEAAAPAPAPAAAEEQQPSLPKPPVPKTDDSGVTLHTPAQACLPPCLSAAPPLQSLVNLSGPALADHGVVRELCPHCKYHAARAGLQACTRQAW
jgi:hypothetical protein